MIRVKIAFKNLLRHKFSSLVLVVVFLLATLALFWVLVGKRHGSSSDRLYLWFFRRY